MVVAVGVVVFGVMLWYSDKIYNINLSKHSCYKNPIITAAFPHP